MITLIRVSPRPIGFPGRSGQARHAKLPIDPGAPGQAVEHGWKDVAHLESDPNLAPIRADPAYKALVVRLRASKNADRPKH